MKMLFLCAGALVASAPAFTQTAIPATPTLTAGAEFKGLRFDWEPVAGATSYQLEYRAHQNGSFVAQGGALQASTTSTHFTFPLHLFDWTYARYRLAACNSAGCSRSAEVSVSLLRRDAVGYFKPSQTLAYQAFGGVDLSPDGYNFVVTAPGDLISEGGSEREGGAIYVFRRGSNGTWAQRARLTPTVPPVIPRGGVSMRAGISASGNTIALAMADYYHRDNDPEPGEVQVFHWNGSSWARTRIARAASDSFGRWVALSDSGFTLAVGLGSGDSQVALYRLTSGVWRDVRHLPNSVNGTEACGYPMALSRDGSTLAQSCRVAATPTAAERHFIRAWSGSNWTVKTDIPLESSSPSHAGYSTGGLAIDATGDTIAAQISVLGATTPEEGDSQVNVFKRSAGVYAKVAELLPGSWTAGTYRGAYGFSLALSGDGATLAVGDYTDQGQGTGPRAAPLLPGGPLSGAVYVYRLTNTWKLANMVKTNYLPTSNESFGRELALSATGRTLLVGDSSESSSAEGIGGNWRNTDAPGSGAVWMY